VKLIRAPDDLVDKLRDVSKSRGKSLSDYVAEILEQAVAPPLLKKLELELPRKEKETEEAIDDKSRLFESLQKQMERLNSLRKREVNESILKELSLKEAGVYKLAVPGYSVEEIGLRLLMDPVEVQGILKSLIERHYLDEYSQPPEVSESTVPEAQQRQDLPEDKAFEQLLASKMRPDIKEKIERAAKEREMLTSFLSQLTERIPDFPI